MFTNIEKNILLRLYGYIYQSYWLTEAEFESPVTILTQKVTDYTIGYLVWSFYTVSQKKLGHFFTAYSFINIEQIFTKFGTNQSLFILNIMPAFI